MKAMITTAACTGLLASAAAAADLTVTVEGVEARGGTFFVSVQTEDEFMGDSGTDGSMISTPEAGTLTRTYDLPPGEYAVTVWHDDDGNGAFDMGPNGMPLDGWAMSGTMNGMPTFETAKVTVGEDGAKTSMTMTYGR